MSDDDGLVWVKAASSIGSGNCVEVARLPSGQVLMRDSKHPDGPRIEAPAFAAFLADVKAGRFDDFA